MSIKRSGFITIIGRPNAGKSTLLNAILKQPLSIVTKKAQTTRDRILGILSDPKMGQMVLVDTPGLHEAKANGLNEIMVRQSKKSIKECDLIWYLVDPHSSIEHEASILDSILPYLHAKQALLVLMNKSDIPDSKVRVSLQDEVKKYFKKQNIIIHSSRKISALLELGLEELLQESWDLLPEGKAFYSDPEQLTDRPVRFFTSELIRKQLFESLSQELPYSCAVQIDVFEEQKKPIRIEASIFVERESQKPIVIGHQGKKIKEIGQRSRIEIEEFLGQSVFLGLKVKVIRDWSKNPSVLKQFGYVD